MKKLFGVGATLALLAGATIAHAAPVLWDTASGGNGHYYDFIAGGFSQSSAFTLADAAPGESYLVTISSEAEKDFVQALVVSGFGGNTVYWTGGVYDVSDDRWEWGQGPEAGQALTYFFWNGGEPNGNAGEPAIVAGWGGGGQWNDWSPGNGASYVVETTGGVPEAATWAIMLLGFGGMGAILRRRRDATTSAR